MSFQQRHVRWREPMGGGTKKVTTMIDGIRKHRFHALAQPSAGMTCFLMPASALVGITYLLRPVTIHHMVNVFSKHLFLSQKK